MILEATLLGTPLNANPVLDKVFGDGMSVFFLATIPLTFVV